MVTVVRSEEGDGGEHMSTTSSLMYFMFAGTPEALPVPLFGGVAGGLLLLVVVVATVVCLCVRQRNKTSAVSKGQCIAITLTFNLTSASHLPQATPHRRKTLTSSPTQCMEYPPVRRY